MFKAIIFDVDGTLAETEEVHRKAFNRAFSALDLPWNWTQQRYRQLLQVTGGKERIRYFIEQDSPERPPVRDLGAWIRRIHEIKTELYTRMVANGEARLRPGVREVILAAADRGTRLAIATTTSPPNVEALLQSAFGNEGAILFEVICAGDCVPHKKPAADIYLLALEQLGLPGEECIAIEDSRNGLLSSINAGIATVITPALYTDDQNFSEAVCVAGHLGQVNFDGLYERLKAGG